MTGVFMLGDDPQAVEMPRPIKPDRVFYEVRELLETLRELVVCAHLPSDVTPSVKTAGSLTYGESAPVL